MKRPLLLTVVATLAITALVPLAIGFLQLRSNADALLEQVQRTHMVAASSSAARVSAYLSSFDTLSEGVVSNPAVAADPKSPAVTSLLSGLLQADPRVAAVGLYSEDGEKVVLIQRTDLKVEISDVHRPQDSEPTSFVRGKSRPWLRLYRPLPGQGSLVLVADAEPLDAMVQAVEMGPEAQEVLANRQGEVLAGARVSLQSFPPTIVERANSGKLGAESGRYANLQGEDSIVGFAPVEGTSWYVLSRQPALVAELAAQRIRRATWQAAAAAVLLTVLLSSGAYVALIRPLRRLIQAQRELVGDEAALGGGSEIQQLEGAFKILQERIQKSEDLTDVFLGRYKVNELVGSGAMGSVFRAWDPKLRRDVALKTIRVSAEEFDREKLVNSLLEEASISARFHHPNIVTTYDVADTGKNAYIAMEYVQGVSLDAYLWDRITLTAEEVIPVGLAVARALAVAHASDLVHHDVKPGNVLLGLDASIKVTDFGISQLISSAAIAEDVVCGTPGYLAPEALQGEGYGPSSDLFALGIIFYEALTGKHPFFGRNLRQTVINTIVEDPDPIGDVRTDLPADLVLLIDQLLAKDPKDRPAGAQDVVQRLEVLERELEIKWRPNPDTFETLTGSRHQLSHTRMMKITSATAGVAVHAKDAAPAKKIAATILDIANERLIEKEASERERPPES